MSTNKKKIALNNYYSKLSDVQKKKHAEKQGMLCYYEWLDTLLEDCTPEEAGYLLMALYTTTVSAAPWGFLLT